MATSGRSESHETRMERARLALEGLSLGDAFGGKHFLPPGTDRQLFSYLCATAVEVGLVLHFGREPKFYRVICENRFKCHRAGNPRPE